MSASLEARVPFLDNRVIALGRALPWDEKVRRGRTKVVLRELLGESLPRSVTERRKMGFRVPLDPWFRGVLRSRAADAFGRPGLLADLLGSDTAPALLRMHAAGNKDLGSQLWALLVLDDWLRRMARP